MYLCAYMHHSIGDIICEQNIKSCNICIFWNIYQLGHFIGKGHTSIIHQLYFRNSKWMAYKPNVILFILFFYFNRKMLLTFDLDAWKLWIELTLPLSRSVKILQQRNTHLADILQSHVSIKLLINPAKHWFVIPIISVRVEELWIFSFWSSLCIINFSLIPLHSCDHLLCCSDRSPLISHNSICQV